MKHSVSLPQWRSGLFTRIIIVPSSISFCLTLVDSQLQLEVPFTVNGYSTYCSVDSLVAQYRQVGQMILPPVLTTLISIWATLSEFGTYRLCEQRRFRRACAFAQSRQNLRCSLIQAVSQEEPSDRKPDPWPLWMAGHAQLKFFMTECSKTQIHLTRPIWLWSKMLFFAGPCQWWIHLECLPLWSLYCL